MGGDRRYGDRSTSRSPTRFDRTVSERRVDNRRADDRRKDDRRLDDRRKEDRRSDDIRKDDRRRQSPSRSKSPARKDDVRIEDRRRQSRSRSMSPARKDVRRVEDRRRLSPPRSTSPARKDDKRIVDRRRQSRSRSMSPIRKDDRRIVDRKRESPSRRTSPARKDVRRIEDRRRQSRSRSTSPARKDNRRMIDDRRRQSPSRSKSPARKDNRSRQLLSRSRSPARKFDRRERDSEKVNVSSNRSRPVRSPQRNSSLEKKRGERVPERSTKRSPSPASSSNDGGKGKKRSKSKSHKKKSKKSKKKKARSSSSSSSGSDSETQLMIKLEGERAKQLEEARKRKEKMKAMETPEEKRIRRLEKIERKERKRKERMGWDNEYLHYTNTDNPFGDNNLLDTFVWKKKLEKEGLEDLSREEVERINRLKQGESKKELEKVKKRRIERELERQRREEEEALLQRQKEAAQFEQWGNQEDLFHLEQARLRSRIRIKDGRAKPIDLLAQYISAEEELNAIEMHEPYTYLNGLTVTDLEDLIEDIKVYKELEKGNHNVSYWNDITVIVEDELRKLRKLEQDEEYRVVMERREGINPAVANEVASIFKGKSAEQLQQLKTHIQSKLDGSSSGVDISYWESLLSQLKAHIARAQLRDRHQENLQKKLALLKAEQGVEDDDEEEDATAEPGTSFAALEAAAAGDEASRDSALTHTSKSQSADEQEEEEDAVGEAIAQYSSGNFTPKLISQDDIEPGIFVIGEDEDNARLNLARTQVLHIGEKVENVWTAEEKALQKEAKKGMDNDEAVFSVESAVDNVYLWSDKYRPRKPRYFNRVHTGFEWNKYNQTHYDMDNPPPKIVQGYKFNIFYPDLIDKNTTPEYHLTACADNPDFAILRFHAGPPYEDIAFKIVNREWEYSYKRGFRCQFHNNIFQLWFHFKRYRYRR